MVKYKSLDVPLGACVTANGCVLQLPLTHQAVEPQPRLQPQPNQVGIPWLSPGNRPALSPALVHLIAHMLYNASICSGSPAVQTTY